MSLIRRTAFARAQFSGCSSTTNARSETGQMAVCCQNLTLGVPSRHSALAVLVGALFKMFGLFFNALYGEKTDWLNKFCKPPRISVSQLVHGKYKNFTEVWV
jgi:hypothetical protein